MKRFDLITPTLIMLLTANVTFAQKKTTTTTSSGGGYKQPSNDYKYAAPKVTYTPPPAPKPIERPRDVVTKQTQNYGAATQYGQQKQTWDAPKQAAAQRDVQIQKPKQEIAIPKDRGYGQVQDRGYVQQTTTMNGKRVEQGIPSLPSTGLQRQQADQTRANDARAAEAARISQQQIEQARQQRKLDEAARKQAGRERAEAMGRQATPQTDTQARIEQQRRQQMQQQTNGIPAGQRPGVTQRQNRNTTVTEHKKGDGYTERQYDPITGQKKSTVVRDADGNIKQEIKFTQQKRSDGIIVKTQTTYDKSGAVIGRSKDYQYRETKLRNNNYESYIWQPRPQTQFVPVYVGPSFTDDLLRAYVAVQIVRSLQPNPTVIYTGPVVYDGVSIPADQISQAQADRSAEQRLNEYIGKVNDGIYNQYQKEFEKDQTKETGLWAGIKKKFNSWMGKETEIVRTVSAGPNHKVVITDMTNRVIFSLTNKNEKGELKSIDMGYIFAEDGSVKKDNAISLIVDDQVKATYDHTVEGLSLQPCSLAGGQIIKASRLSNGTDGVDDVIVKVTQSEKDVEEDAKYCKSGKDVRLSASDYNAILAESLKRTDDSLEKFK